jgi:hypothetical protein
VRANDLYADDGGKGGSGGRGGAGGAGAGGTGGPVCGILKFGTSSITGETKVTITIGAPGFGGHGPGNAGQSGGRFSIESPH